MVREKGNHPDQTSTELKSQLPCREEQLTQASPHSEGIRAAAHTEALGIPGMTLRAALQPLLHPESPYRLSIVLMF